MNIDIRNRDNGRIITFKTLWMQDQFRKIKMVLPDASNEEIQKLLVEEYEKRRLVEGRFFNNVKNESKKMTQEMFINYYLNNNCIMSGYTTLFNGHDGSVNIAAEALQFLLTSRKVFKKKMTESVYGSDEYIYYKVLQLTFKILANSYYGILGERNSIFYNSFVQNSITMTGQDLITTAILAAENFLSNNYIFNDTDECLTYINNINSETYKNNILDYLDNPIGKEELFNYLVSKTKKINKEILQLAIDNLDQEHINRIFYKNRILDLCKNSWFNKKIVALLQYNIELEVQDEIKGELDDFKEKIIEFCYYNYLFEERYKHSQNDMRKTVIVVDTDSIFTNMKAYVDNFTSYLDGRTVNEVKKISVMNIIINIFTDVLKKTFWLFTTNMGITDESKPIINMKNEFILKKILTTRNKKNYASLVMAELGKILPRPVLDIKGLSIRKSNVPKQLRREFTDILSNDILKANTIDLQSIIKKYDDLGENIKESLKAGETLYALPKNVELVSGYVAPDTIEQVRATIIWNALEPEHEIVPPEKINMLKLNALTPDSPELLKLAETHPEKYKAIMDTVFNESNKLNISRFGLSCIAIPKSIEKIPNYIIPFIDFETMVNNNMSNGYILLESLSIFCEEVQTVQYKSNIIEI